MVLEYTHLELNEDINFISGYYTPQKEVRLSYNNREVLYILGQAMADGACCGIGGCRYALVPGYLVNWKNKTNEAGLPVSEVEPISDQKVRQDIGKIIRVKEIISQIDFWG